MVCSVVCVKLVKVLSLHVDTWRVSCSNSKKVDKDGIFAEVAGLPDLGCISYASMNPVEIQVSVNLVSNSMYI